MINHSRVNGDEYQKHHVFDEIGQMMDYYEGVSDTCYSFMPHGTRGIVNYATYVFMSIKRTLDSVRMLLKEGHITDAFVLIRKYFDTVLVEIYIDVVRKEKFDWVSEIVVKDVDDWICSAHRIPSMKKLLKILKESASTRELYPFFGWDSYLKHNRELLDNDVHVNRYNGLLMNCPDLVLDGRENQLENASIILKQVFTMHLAFIFYLNGHYMMASDYMDHMEMGLTPPKGCESWIAPYAQDAFDVFIKPRTRLAEIIKKHCSLEIN